MIRRAVRTANIARFVLLAAGWGAALQAGRVNSGGAQGLLAAASSLQSAWLVRLPGKDTLHRFQPAELDSLKKALVGASLSGSPRLTPAPWPVALVLDCGRGKRFVALYIRDVLRVKAQDPFSPRIANPDGSFPASGIADLVLDWDHSYWLYGRVEKLMGEPPAKPYRIPGPGRLDLPE